jgi:TetR/AcrR family transcriptional regulator, transcriptional repressor for nem operon
MKREEGMRERLLDVAQDLVQRVGANAMSYQDLSQALGITKASIHYYFPTKADLLEQLVRRYSSYFLEVVDRILAREENGREKLRQYCALFEATAAESGGEKACPCGMLGAEAATLGEATLERLRRFYTENNLRLRRILEQGRQDGSLRFEGDPAEVASLIFATLEGGLMVTRVEGAPDGFRNVARQLLRQFEP